MGKTKASPKTQCEHEDSQCGVVGQAAICAATGSVDDFGIVTLVALA